MLACSSWRCCNHEHSVRKELEIASNSRLRANLPTAGTRRRAAASSRRRRPGGRAARPARTPRTAAGRSRGRPAGPSSRCRCSMRPLAAAAAAGRRTHARGRHPCRGSHTAARRTSAGGSGRASADRQPRALWQRGARTENTAAARAIESTGRQGSSTHLQLGHRRVAAERQRLVGEQHVWTRRGRHRVERQDKACGL